MGEALSKQTGISILVADATQLCANAFNGCNLTAVTFKQVVTDYESAFTGATVSGCDLVLAEGQSAADITAEGNTLKWAGASWASIQVGDVEYKALGGYACKVMVEDDDVYYEYTDQDSKKYAVIDGATTEDKLGDVQNQIEAAAQINDFLVVNELALYTGSRTAGTVVGEAIRQLAPYNPPTPMSARSASYAFNITLVHEAEVPENAFYGCLALNSVTLPSSDNTTITIGANAFQNCTSLTGISSLDNVTSIGEGAFQNCTGLTGNLSLDNVTSIGSWAFQYCTGLTGVSLPNVEEIGNYAFYKCTGLTGDLSLPNVESIGYYAFCNCTSLTGISSLGSVTTIENNTFNGCSGLTGDLSLPNVTSIGNSAFQNCTGLTGDLSLPYVKSIGTCAFDGCSGLTTLTLPNVESIGTSAFYGCTFTKVTFNKVVTSYGYAFNGANVSNCALELAAGQNGVTAYGQTLTWADKSWASIKVGNYKYFKENGYVILTIDGNDAIKYTVIDGSCGRGGENLISPDDDVDPVKNQINNAPSYKGAKNLWVINNLSSWLNDGIYYSVIGTAINNFNFSGYDFNLVLADADIIPGNAFYNCQKLKSVDTYKVTSVGKSAFNGCKVLTNLTFRTVVNSTDYYAFSGVGTEDVTLYLNTGQNDVDVRNNKWKGYTWDWINFLE